MCDTPELAFTYCGLAQDISKLDTVSQFQLLQHVETFFENQADTDLGDFLNEYAKLLVFSSVTDLQDGNIHQFMQDLIDASELDEDLLFQVCNTMSCLYQYYSPLTIA
jgi:hypothetical protein